MTPSVAAIISAAGSSSRMGGRKKEYLPLSGEKNSLTVLGAALKAFVSCPRIGPIVITVPPGAENGKNAAFAALPGEFREGEALSGGKSPLLFVSGGPTRRASVHNALLSLEPYRPSHVLIHDGARPWVSPELIERVIDAALRYGAVIPALPLVETPKELTRFPGAAAGEAEQPDIIRRHLKRAELCTAQTPQGFQFPEILRVHEKAREKEAREGAEYTDDAEVWGEFAGPVAVISGDPENRKITYPEDIGLRSAPARDVPETGETSAQRIGIGRDLHRLQAGRKFLLGGVEIPAEKGELGHSDGDVLAHAVTDALLGAAGLGDIGELYPPSDPAWKGADSLVLLSGAWSRVREQGWRLVNLDCTVNCETPKILPYRNLIRRSLSEALQSDPGLVFVKGKTNEGLGPVGAGEAVEAMAVCLLEKCRKGSI